MEMWDQLCDGVFLAQGDCTRSLPQLPEGLADYVIADPPYSSGAGTLAGVQASTRSKYAKGAGAPVLNFAGDAQDQFSLYRWSSWWLSDCYRVAKEGAICAVFTDWRQLRLMADAMQAAGWSFKGVAVWDKGNSRPQRGRYRQQAEFIVWGTKGTRSTKAGPVVPGVFTHTNVQGKARQHQTQKPVALIQDLFRLIPDGGVVLDPFMGSGSAGEAALLMSRNLTYYGIELSPAYHHIATERLRSL
ncbi:DNA-methyltransferase [Magnetococcus sp. PR-3]|uniref:DNA-methyltransferase n=1 Tax=Magnetococcus sp. PR-3 TaxID=3120355 RepID=UPI002FCE1795